MKELLFLFAWVITVEAVCRNGWVRFEGSCYLFTITPTETWTTARAYCTSAQGHLAEINTKSENDFLINHVTYLNSLNSRYWIGGEDFEQEGYWVWARTGIRISPTFWGPGEPNERYSHEDCLNLMWHSYWQNYWWNDQNCDNKYSFICELEDGAEIIG